MAFAALAFLIIRAVINSHRATAYAREAEPNHGTSIAPIPWEHLLGFAGLWLANYGGGHTIKSVLGR